MKLKIKKWYIWVSAFVALAVWLRLDNKKAEVNEKMYQETLAELSTPISIDKACVLWKNAYDYAGSDNDRRLCLGKLILCYENMGDLFQAQSLLEKYETEFEESTSTTIHSAIILAKTGDEQKCKHILDSLIDTPIFFDEPSFIKKSLDLLCGNTKEAQSDAYLDYFYEFICRLVSIQFRASIEPDNINRVECLGRFEKYESIDNVIKKYQDFCESQSGALSFFHKQRICILQQTHLYMPLNYWNPEIAIDDALRFKWNFIQMFLDEYDSCYGFEYTKEHFRNIIASNKVSSEGYQKFLIDAYMESGNKNSKYSLDYEGYKSLFRNGWGWLVQLTPTSLLNQPSAFINAGVTKPCILLSCNGWNVCDSTLFTRDMVLKDKGKTKQVIILKDDFSTDTLRIQEDLLGVNISYRHVNSLTLDLVRKRASNGE